MPQNPVDTTLFASKIAAGSGITVSPTSGTGIVTVSSSGQLSTTQVSTLTVTNLATLHTTQVGSLAVTQIIGAGTFIANGATGVTTAIGGLTATSVILSSLKTVGGTVTTPPHALFPPNLGNGTVVLATAASDTSTYNVAAIG